MSGPCDAPWPVPQPQRVPGAPLSTLASTPSETACVPSRKSSTPRPQDKRWPWPSCPFSCRASGGESCLVWRKRGQPRHCHRPQLGHNRPIWAHPPGLLPPPPSPPWPPSLSPPGGVETVKPPRPSSSTGPPGRWRCRLSSVWNALRFPLGVSSSLFHLSSLSTSSGGCRKFLDPLRLTPLLRSRCRDLDANSTFLFSIRFVTLVGNAPFSTLVSRCWELQVDLTRNPFTAGTVHNRVIRRGKKTSDAGRQLFRIDDLGGRERRRNIYTNGREI